MKFFSVSLMVGILFLSSALAPQANAGTSSPEGAEVYIISPSDGETVSKNVTIRFGLKGMGVAPAGTDKTKTGHHHLMVDGEKLPPMDQPMNKKVVKHFGGGQTEVTLSLSPGKHTLQLILGDKAHVPHEPPVVSKSITITVK